MVAYREVTYLNSFEREYATEYKFADEFIYKLAIYNDGSQIKLETYEIIEDIETEYRHYCIVLSDEYQIEMMNSYINIV